MYYMGFTYQEAYRLPVWQRTWFLQRISRELKESSKKERTASRSLQHNTPDARAMQGMARSHVPAKLRRFT
jgi:hypothetical protein|tara:strand:- start:698 stop:910 length:213 start_codon:yes stop_codon:yes gene_type:complete